MSTPNPPTTHRSSLIRRIAAELDTSELEITAAGDRIQIAGTSAAIDQLLDRIESPRRPIDRMGTQLSLFDPAPYTTIQSLPASDDSRQLRLTSSTDRGAA